MRFLAYWLRYPIAFAAVFLSMPAAWALGMGAWSFAAWFVAIGGLLIYVALFPYPERP